MGERERIKKEEEAKIIITPAVLPAKKEEESEEESEEEEEPEPEPVKKKLSLSDLKPAVQIKMAIPAEEPPTRRRKTVREPSVDEGFLATTKPKVPEPVIATVPEGEEESEEEEDEPEPEPVKKKLSLSDLKPSVQIKMAIPADEPPTRRRKNVREPSVDEGFLANIPEVPKVAPPPVIEEESITVEEVAEVESTPGKDRLSDEFAERVRIKKEEDAKIIITPAVLPVKEEPPKVEEEAITVEAVAEVESTPGKDKVRDEFAERERLKKEEEAKIIITPAVLPAKKEEESEEESEEEEE